MIRFTLILICLTFTSQKINAATLYSRANGNWNNGNSWSTESHTGISCNCTPSSADLVYIAHNITLNKNLINQGSDQNGITGLLHIAEGATLNGGNNYDIDIRSTGTLYLCGDLSAKNVIFSNGSSILVCSSGNLNVNGNFENKNNGNNVIINGTLTVAGSFTNGFGGVITGSGVVGITNGPVYNSGTTMGCAGDPCSSYPCTINSGCSVLLPVELTGFGADVYSNYIRISWTTGSEKNNDYFILEKSIDGEVYSELSRIKGIGNSIVNQNYAYRDMYPETGYNYYRLKQIDFDGNSKSYDPISVIFRSNSQVWVHPNPSSGNALTVTLNLPDDKASIEIINLSGTSYFSTTKNLDKNSIKKFVIEEIKNFPDGLYTLRVTGTSGVQQEKLLISNQ